MGSKNWVEIKFDNKPKFPLVLFSADDCILYKSADDMRHAWLNCFELDFKDIKYIYDCEAVPYTATESIILEKGLIFNSKRSCYTFNCGSSAREDHEANFRRLAVAYLSSRQEPTVDTGTIGMEGLQINSPMNELLDRIEAYAVAMA